MYDKNNSVVYGNILKTNDYDIFKSINGNRKINQSNYAKIYKSMQEEQLIIPIIVNENFEIIDGQHRFEACKNLGKPVYYIIVKGYGLSQVNRANIASSNWKKDDYLEMFIHENKKDYIDFKSIVEKYNINISNLLKIFAIVQEKQVANINHDFEEGIFTLNGKMFVLNCLNALEDFRFFKYYKSNNFITAFTKLFFQERYDHSKMISKLSTHKATLEKRNSFDEYLVLLCNKMYSYGATKNPLYYSSESKKFHQ